MNEPAGQAWQSFLTCWPLCVYGTSCQKMSDFSCSHSWVVERSGETPFAVGNTGRKPSELCSEKIIGEEMERNRSHPTCFIGVKKFPFTKCLHSFGFSLCLEVYEE